MTDTTPDGPTYPQLSAVPSVDATTIVSPVSPSPGGPPVVPPPPGSPLANSPNEALSPTMTALPPEPPGRVYGTGDRRHGGDSDLGDSDLGDSATGDVSDGSGGADSSAGSAQPPAVPAPLPGGDRGKTTIADEVVERVIDKIVNLTVAEVGGVQGLHADEGQPVSVTIEADQAEIAISVRVEFGHAVHEVVEQLRSGVIGQVERLLGLTVTEVNVLVADVTFDTQG